MNILITSIGNKINLIKYFRRALFNEGGGTIYGIDSNSLNNGRHFVDQFLLAPKVSEERYQQWLLDTITQYSIDLVIPSRDGDLEVLADLREKAANIFCRIAVADPAVLVTCLDKERFNDWCLQQGIATVLCLDRDNVTAADLPVFIKPKKGSASEGCLKIDSVEQWQKIKLELSDQFLVQEYIDAPEYTVDLFVDSTGNVKTVVPRRRLLVDNGESIHGKVELDEIIIKASTELAKKLKLNAHNTLQCFKRGGSVLFSEVNARFGGGFTLSVEAGADTPRFLVQESLGKSITVDQEKMIDKLEMLRIQKDVFIGNQSKKIYCFDLDGTICTESCRYEDALPIKAIVEKVNKLYADGHEIVIATARGAASGVSWEKLVIKQLSEWGVNYHRLVMGKPFAYYYVDNKAVDVLEFIK